MNDWGVGVGRGQGRNSAPNKRADPWPSLRSWINRIPIVTLFRSLTSSAARPIPLPPFPASLESQFKRRQFGLPISSKRAITSSQLTCCAQKALPLGVVSADLRQQHNRWQQIIYSLQLPQCICHAVHEGYGVISMLSELISLACCFSLCLHPSGWFGPMGPTFLMKGGVTNVNGVVGWFWRTCAFLTT